MTTNKGYKEKCIFCYEWIGFGEYACDNCLFLNAQKQGITKEDCLKKIKEQVCQGCVIRVKWLNIFNNEYSDREEIPIHQLLGELIDHWMEKTNSEPETFTSDLSVIISTFINKVNCYACSAYLKDQKEMYKEYKRRELNE